MKVDEHVVTVLSALFAGIAACMTISCIETAMREYGTYFYDEDIATHIEKNPKVASARILGSEFDIPTRYDVEINTVSGYRLCLHYVKRSCHNDGICVTIINDISYHGGRGFVLQDGERIYHNPIGAAFLGKLLGKNIQSVDDIVENADELYGLFELFEANSRKEFMYGDRFIINADFKRGEPDPDWPV